MATKPMHKPKYHAGSKVRSHYRNVTFDAVVDKVTKRGRTADTTKYAIEPLKKFRHAGEAKVLSRRETKLSPR